MSDKSQSNMFKDLIKGALTTAISVLVTYYVTSAIKTDQNQQSNVEKEKQRMEALEKTNVLLISYISRYDSLHTKYLTLLENRGGVRSLTDAVEIAGMPPVVATEESSTNFNKVSALLVDGNWMTPDGTVQWRFSNKQVVVNGVGSYIGFIEGSGSFNASGGQINGTMHITKAFYLATNENITFSLTLSSDHLSMYGTNTDGNGNVNAMTLYKY